MNRDATKSYFLNDGALRLSGFKPINDLGYSLDIPVADVVTSGWMDAKPKHADGTAWGNENKITTSREPEFYAPWGQVRSNGGLPIINVNDRRYAFDRSMYTYKVY